MEGNGRLSLIVGGFVLTCLGAAVIAVLSLTSEKGIFTKSGTRWWHAFRTSRGCFRGHPSGWRERRSAASVGSASKAATQNDHSESC